MQPTPDPYGSARSGLPMPSTVKKAPQSSVRMSLSGPAMRAPYLPPAGSGPSSNPRQSIYRGQNANPLLQSTSKQNYGRTPLHSSTRRGSIWTGNASLAAPSGSQTLKDPRPIRDRAYQSKMRQEIFSWLQTTEYEISMQTLMSITGKDYRAMFQHLVNLVDPYYPFDPKMRFEDEFQPALRALRYPFASQLDNKWLAAPGSMHSWPTLLAVLHWLVVMGKARLQYLESDDPTLQNVERIPEEFFDPIHHQALAFEYFCDAYIAFFHGADVFEEQDKVLEARYAKKNERTLSDLEEKKEKLAQLQTELSQLQSSAAPLEKLQKTHGFLVSDRAKFHDVLQRFEARKKHLIDTIAHENAEVTTRAANLDQLKSEHSKLLEIVKVQNLTPEEVVRMNNDHETLSRNLEELKHKISETQKTVMSLEVMMTNRATAVEEALDQYTNFLSSLGLFPPLPAPFEGVDLTVQLNLATSNVSQLLSGAEIKRVIKPTLSAIAELKRSERADVESERIKVDNDLDQLTLECENVHEEVSELEKKVVVLNEQADELRDASQQESTVSNAEAARLERELAHARTVALSSGMGVKSRLQALLFSYREQQAKVSRLKEETIRAIAKNSNEIALFKEEVSAHLRQLREFVAEGG
ncbi:HEC/Ndc80p family-domain-containing protein [Scleroderma yunnanense]